MVRMRKNVAVFFHILGFVNVFCKFSKITKRLKTSVWKSKQDNWENKVQQSYNFRSYFVRRAKEDWSSTIHVLQLVGGNMVGNATDNI